MIFSLFTNLKAKESCNWWLTRSILGFWQQKSDVKYLPMSVANIGVLQEPFRKRKWCLRDFVDTQEGLRNILQQHAIFAGLRSWLPPWGSQLPACGIYRATSGGNTPYCTKRLRNHFAAKGWFRNTLENASFSLEWLTCNGCSFFVSTLNYAPFEALDFWLPELWNGI